MTRRALYPTLAATAVLVTVLASTSRSGEPSDLAAQLNKDGPTTRGAIVQTAPASMPTTTVAAGTQPSPATTQAKAMQGPPILPPQPLPPEFAILQTRSPFLRGKPKSNSGPNPQESSMVFRGVTETDDVRLVAYIEDRSSKKVVQLGAGDPLARGKVKKIDLDAIEYEAGGSVKKIAVGQNLNGEVIPPTPASKPAPPPGAQPPGGPPGQPGQPMPGQPQPGQMPPGAQPRPSRGAQPVPEG